MQQVHRTFFKLYKFNKFDDSDWKTGYSVAWYIYIKRGYLMFVHILSRIFEIQQSIHIDLFNVYKSMFFFNQNK